MKNIFVICAWESRARANFQKTVLNPIPDEDVLSCFQKSEHAQLREWREVAGGFYAWGIKETPRSLTMWKSLTPGDCVLSFFDRHYRAVARLVGKTQNDKLAEKVWGTPKDSQHGWRNILFLTKSLSIKVPAERVCPPMCITYRGATRLGAARIAEIVAKFGSLEAFVAKTFEQVPNETQT